MQIVDGKSFVIAIDGRLASWCTDWERERAYISRRAYFILVLCFGSHVLAEEKGAFQSIIYTLLWENEPLQPRRVNYSFSSKLTQHRCTLRMCVYCWTPKEDGFLKWKKREREPFKPKSPLVSLQHKHSAKALVLTNARYYACQFHVCMKHRQQYTYFPFCFYGWPNEDVGKWMRNERRIHTNFVHQRVRNEERNSFPFDRAT